MTTPKEILLQTLDGLKNEEFKKFKWLMCEKGVLKDFPAITMYQLEEANRMDTVDLMFSTYCINTIKVTKMLLVRMLKNDLAERLPENMLETSGQRREASQRNVAGVYSEDQSPADDRLLSIRKDFIDKISDANLNTLLDELLAQRVINYGEMETARTYTRADKARNVIDVVRRKGAEASSGLIAALRKVDPCLSRTLNLQ